MEENERLSMNDFNNPLQTDDINTENDELSDDLVSVATSNSTGAIENKNIDDPLKPQPLVKNLVPNNNNNNNNNVTNIPLPVIPNSTPGNNMLSLDSDCELMQREFGIGSEIEYEICIKLSSEKSISNVFKAQYSSNNDNNEMQNDENKWTIWKTAKEILNLHACVLGTFGDAAPRRPKLKTTPELNRSSTGNNTIIPHSAIVSDMRTIAAYITGLLQHHRQQKCVEIYNFLEIDKNTHPTTNNSERNFDVSDEEEGYENENFNRDSEGGREIENYNRDGRENDNYNRENENYEENDYDYQSGIVTPRDPMSMSADSRTELIREMSTGGNLTETVATSAERWRKLFVNIRMHLKPSPIAVRYLLFCIVLFYDSLFE